PARALLLRREAAARLDSGLARLLPGHVPGAGAALEPPLPCRRSVGLSRGARRLGARTRGRPDRGLGRGGARLLRSGAVSARALLAARTPCDGARGRSPAHGRSLPRPPRLAGR